MTAVVASNIVDGDAAGKDKDSRSRATHRPLSSLCAGFSNSTPLTVSDPQVPVTWCRVSLPTDLRRSSWGYAPDHVWEGQDDGTFDVERYSTEESFVEEDGEVLHRSNSNRTIATSVRSTYGGSYIRCSCLTMLHRDSWGWVGGSRRLPNAAQFKVQ